MTATALTNWSDRAYEAVDFDQFSEDDFIPALNLALEEARKNLESYRAATDNTYESVIEGLNLTSEKLDRVAEVFYCLHSAHATDKIQSIAQEFNEKLTDFSNEVSLCPKIFARVKKLYDARAGLNLTKEQERVLELQYKSFTRNGALLNEEDKKILEEINKESSALKVKFGENSLKAHNAYSLHVKDDSSFGELPQDVRDLAKKKAQDKDLEGYLFTLDFPLYGPFVKYVTDRKLREEINRAAGTKASHGEFDNSEIVTKIVELRRRRAQLLGFKTHAHYVLEERMAKTPEKVMGFLNEVLEKSLPMAKNEIEAVKKLAKEKDGIDDLKPWDLTYYSNLYRQQELNFDDQVLRPYFKLENVIAGAFQTATKLFGIEFLERSDIPKYHSEVMTYEVRDIHSKEFVGLFYADFFPRESKRQGAWMTSLREQGTWSIGNKRPHIVNVCNFPPSTDEHPSLLTLNDVRTLFHEFGHGLHGLLSQCESRSVAGTNVYWDFVELPSQLMENWLYEKEGLDLFAKHYQTGESIPDEYITKIQEERKFLEAMATVRQVSFAFLDMTWHSNESEHQVDSIDKFEEQAMQKTQLLERVPGFVMSTSFGHLFAGGYSAGYYSYKWAEVLDADVFAAFKEKGIFDSETAKSFKENILERGGSEDPMELFKAFRGREPKIEPLLERAGIL